jgi:hypothetical protein
MIREFWGYKYLMRLTGTDYSGACRGQLFSDRWLGLKKDENPNSSYRFLPTVLLFVE